MIYKAGNQNDMGPIINSEICTYLHISSNVVLVVILNALSESFWENKKEIIF
jgi:hypothetical protein